MAVVQGRALPGISVIRYAIFEWSEGKEEGCSSMMREHCARETPDRLFMVD
jgi:hypothetical protein